MSEEHTIFPKSRLIKVEFEIALPIAATPDEIEEWLALEFGCGSMSSVNPLGSYDVEALKPPVLTDTGFHLHEEATDNGDGTWTVRKWREGSPFDGPSATETVFAKRHPSGAA